MNSSNKRLEQTQHRLAKLEALQQTLEQIDQELTAYRSILVSRLEILKHGAEPVRSSGVGYSRPTPSQQPAAGSRPGARLTPIQGLTARPSPQPTPVPELSEQQARERRAAPRRKGNPVPVLLTNVHATLEPFQGWVLDRSSGGLRILVDQQVTVGTTLCIRPAKASGSFPWIQIQVRSCQPERSSFSLGVQFLQKLAWNELQAFG